MTPGDELQVLVTAGELLKTFLTILPLLNKTSKRAISTSRTGPCAWNDPDMLEIGNGGLTHEEKKTHFALWAIAKAPLIIGCDLSIAPQSSHDILMNTDLIAVNHDSESR